MNQDNETIVEPSRYCTNELRLLNSFDTLPTWKGNFKDLGYNLENQISGIYDDDICCKKLRFNVYHLLSSTDSIKLSLHHYFHCNVCPIFIRELNNWNVLLNSKGQVLYEGEFLPIDTLSSKIFEYYSNVGIIEYLPESYKKVNIVINWDKDVSNEHFRLLINQIIKGYLLFVNTYSNKTNHKKICEMNLKELDPISAYIPFNIEIQILYQIEEVNTFP